MLSGAAKDADLVELDRLWEDAKRAERSASDKTRDT